MQTYFGEEVTTGWKSNLLTNQKEGYGVLGVGCRVIDGDLNPPSIKDQHLQFSRVLNLNGFGTGCTKVQFSLHPPKPHTQHPTPYFCHSCLFQSRYLLQHLLILAVDFA